MTSNEDALRCADVAFLAGMNATGNHLRRLVAENEALKADRDSWADQASDRLKDWDDMRRQCEAQDALLRQAEALLKRVPKATMAMYVGKDRIGYGRQALQLAAAIGARGLK